MEYSQLKQKFDLDEFDLDSLNNIAAQSVQHGFKFDAPKNINPSTISNKLKVYGRVCVSFSYQNEILGLRGNNFEMPLFASVNESAFNAAFKNHKTSSLIGLNKHRSSLCECKIYFSMNQKKYFNLTLPKLLETIEGKNVTFIVLDDTNKVIPFSSILLENKENKENYINSIIQEKKQSNQYDFTQFKVIVRTMVEGKSFKLKEMWDQNEI